MAGASKTKVLFVGGYGRSGSTIIDLLLDRIPGVVAVGEFRHLFGRALGDDELCSCGRPFSDCPFWSAVLALAFPGGYDRARIQQAVSNFNRIVMVPKLRNPDRQSAVEKADAQLYRQAFTAVYRAVAHITGASVIVDSTKYPMHGWFLRTMPEIDLRTMLLVRDPRAVAYSWQRRRLRPEVHWEQREMPRHSAVRSGLAWNLSNRLTADLASSPVTYRLQRYEDFVSDPAGQLAEIAAFALGRPVTLPDDLFEKQPGPPHTIAGNPIRIGSEHIRVKADDEWQDMPLTDRLVVDAVCLPGMRWYGYPLRIKK